MSNAEKIADVSEINQLISLGKEKGFLTYEEVNDVLPANLVAPEQIAKLDGNENAYGPSPRVFEALASFNAHTQMGGTYVLNENEDKTTNLFDIIDKIMSLFE